MLSRTLYRIRVAAHAILKVREEDAMNDVLFAPLSNYIEGVISKLTSISNKAISRIKADSGLQALRLGSHEETGWSLATLTSVKYV